MLTLEQSTKAQKGIIHAVLLFLLPSRLMAVGGQRHDPATLPPGKNPVPIVKEAECGKPRPTPAFKLIYVKES